MSKRSLFWGQASGKLGETVLYRAGGEQRTRTYVAKIKNPKTLPQVENRLSMLNFSATFRNMKSILANSFPNRPTNQSGFNAFVKANKTVNSPVISQEAVLAGLCVPYNMTISEGYLNEWGENIIVNATDGEVVGYEVTNSKAAEEIATAMASSSSVTTGSVVKTLVRTMGIPENANITMVLAEYADTGYKVSYKTFKVADLGTDNKWGNFTIGFAKDRDDEHFYFGALNGGDMFNEEMAALIISWKDASGKLQITTSRIITTIQGKEYADQFVKGGNYYNDVLNHYGYNVSSALG